MGFDVVSARGESVFTHKMLDVTNAVILMAGSGSRLRASGRLVPKPLVPVLEKPLICYTLDSLRQAGITTVHAVVGFESDRLLTELDRLVPKSMEFRSIENPNWEKKNGISLLAAAKYVVAPFLLVMADHLFEYSLVDILLRHAHPNFLNLAVDRKIESVFDLADAMKVQTRGDRIGRIGKDLETYDAIDTGLFVCPESIFDYLERAKDRGDCSLADGVSLMAEDDKARAIDIGDGWWQDIDTQEMLSYAENVLSRGVGSSTSDQTLCRER